MSRRTRARTRSAEVRSLWCVTGPLIHLVATTPLTFRTVVQRVDDGGSLRNDSRVSPHARSSRHISSPGSQSAALVRSVRSHYEVTFSLHPSWLPVGRRITLRARHRTSTDTGQPYTEPHSLCQAPEYGRKIYGRISHTADPADQLAPKACARKHVLLDDER